MKQSGWQTFLTLCQGCETTEQLDEFFKFFLSPDEQQQMSNRVEIIKALLAEKETQRVMATRLKVSIAVITRGSNLLKLCSEWIRTYLSQHLLK